MKLWLDDVRPAPEGWAWVKNVQTARVALRLGKVSEASLDHDLGEDEPTGYDLVSWMEETGCWPSGQVHVHSANPVGAARMRQVIDRRKK